MIRKFVESLAYSPDSKEHRSGKSPDLAWSLVELRDVSISVATLEPGEKPIATLVHFHGSGFNVTKHLGHVDWLAREGIRVVMFDYPGYGRSTGQPTRNTVTESGCAVLSHVLRSCNEPIFVFGQSLGGAIALASLAKERTKIAGLILDSTFSSYRVLAKLKLSRRGLPYSLAQYLFPLLLPKAEEPVNLTRFIDAPVLLLHSRTDSVVPYSEGKTLAQSFGQNCEFLTQDGPDHTGVFRPNYQDYRERLRAWIEERSPKR